MIVGLDLEFGSCERKEPTRFFVDIVEKMDLFVIKMIIDFD